MPEQFFTWRFSYSFLPTCIHLPLLPFFVFNAVLRHNQTVCERLPQFQSVIMLLSHVLWCVKSRKTFCELAILLFFLKTSLAILCHVSLLGVSSVFAESAQCSCMFILSTATRNTTEFKLIKNFEGFDWYCVFIISDTYMYNVHVQFVLYIVYWYCSL